jgi:transposase
VERGFRFLKDPLFLASSLYLKSPKRIMTLMRVMTLCLLVYAHLTPAHVAQYAQNVSRGCRLVRTFSGTPAEEK